MPTPSTDDVFTVQQESEGVYRHVLQRRGSRNDTFKFVALDSNLNNLDFVAVIELARRNGD
jgi:hypothetical protein